MVEDCYILYSCDGSYEPIVSNYSGFSAYSSSFVGIKIVDISITANTCFYVLSLGEIDCSVTEDVIPVTGVTCDCPCYCYFIRSVTETTDVTYVDCNDNIVVETIELGLTYSICSKIYPQFDIEVQIPIKLTDICVDNNCPSTIPSVSPSNECDVITIFPISIECLIQQPSDNESFDGSTSLIITGGTPPYTIFWEIGSFAPTLINLGVGQYDATVTDYYGDFTATTTCVLSAETLTISGICFVVENMVTGEIFYINSESQGQLNGKPYYFLQSGIENLGYVFWDGNTELWTFCVDLQCQGSPYNTLNNGQNFYPTGNTGDWIIVADSLLYITESYLGRCILPVTPQTQSELCVNLVVRSDDVGYLTENVLIPMDPSNEINGEPSWSSSTGQYLIYWNSGATPPQWVMTGYPNVSLINYDTSNPPLTNWQILGSPSVYEMLVLSGECFSAYTINLSINANDALCQQDGSITVNANGGVPPYQFSINGGTSYQLSTIFNGLIPGTYYVMAVDSNLVSSIITQVVINGTLPTVYTLGFGVSTSTNTFSVAAQILPPGVSISFDLVHSSIFNYYPNTITPIPSYNNFATITGVGPLSLYNTLTSTSNISGPCTQVYSPLINNQIINVYYSAVTLTSGQIINGTVTNQITNFIVGNCKSASGTYQIQLANTKINNCNCCSVEVIGT
jgi:hypothetical protein